MKICPNIVLAARTLMRTDGKSRRQAAAVLGISYSGLSAALVRKKIRKETRGRPAKLSKIDLKNIRKLREAIKKTGGNPVSRHIRRQLKLARKVSVRTIQRAQRLNGDRYLHRKNKATLHKEDQAARLKWGLQSADTDWDSVDLWVDCHSVSMPLKTAPKRSGMAWRKPSEGDNDWAVKGHKSSMAPGTKLFGGFGGGRLIFLKSYTTFNRFTCVEFFKRTVVPALRRMYGSRRYLIMCDGDGAFKSFLFEQYCKEAGIDLIEWPPYSADLAPMENTWAEGDSRLEVEVNASRTWRTGVKVNQTNLKAWDVLVHKKFRGIPSSFYVNAAAGMEARIARMVELKGARIRK